MDSNWINAGGIIPSGWELVPLKDLLLNDKAISVGVMYPGEHLDGGIPLIKVGDVTNGEILKAPDSRISPVVDEEYKRTRLVGNELLITLVGNPGECVIVEPHMKGWNAARALAVLRFKNPEIRHWLKLIIQSKPSRHIIDSRLNTTVQKTLNLKDVKELPVLMPSEKIRDSLCCYYYTLEHKSTLNRQINQTLEQMAQALFKSWFVDFDPTVDNALDAGFFEQDLAFPDELLRRAEARRAVREHGDFKPLPDAIRQLFPAAFEECAEPSLGLGGWVPKGWSVWKLENLMELAYGKALKSTDRIDGHVPVYGSGGITGYHNEPLVDGPSIIVGRKGTVGSLYWEDRPFFPIDTVFYVRSEKPLTYCFSLLQTLGLTEMNTDAAVPGLNRNNAYRLQVITPNDDVLNAFDTFAATLRKRIFAHTEQIKNLTNLRDTLLPKLISGELRLDNIEADLTTEEVA